MKTDPIIMKGSSDSPLDYEETNGDGLNAIMMSHYHDEKEKRTRSRKWSDEEVDLYLNILGDTRYMFAASLENLVPKKRSNYEIFTSIRRVFQRELRDRHRQRIPGFEYSLSLDLSLEKLRKKYSNLKVEWRKLSDKQQKAEPDTIFPEPRWFRSVQKLMADIKAASEDVNLSAIDPCVDELSDDLPEDVATMASEEDFSSPYRSLTDDRRKLNKTTNMINNNNNNNNKRYREFSPTNNNIISSSSSNNNNNGPINSIPGQTIDYEAEPRYGKPSENIHLTKRSVPQHEQFPYKRPPTGYPDRFVYVEPEYKRPKLSYSHEQQPLVGSSITELAEGLKQLAELQLKRQQIIIEAEYKNYDLFLRHKEQEADRNRAHELQLADIYAKALTSASFGSPSAYSPPASRVNFEPPVVRSFSELEKEMTTPTFVSSHVNHHRNDQH